MWSMNRRMRIVVCSMVIVHLMVGSALADMEAGVQYSVPERWHHEQPSSQMRKAQWSVPRVADDAEDAELTLFYFGPQQGGSVEANVARWTGQFSSVGEHATHMHEVSGVSVTIVEATGTFSSGLPMDRGGPKPNFALRGAIVEGPQGLVFFKLIGPRATVEAANDEFHGLIESLRPV